MLPPLLCRTAFRFVPLALCAVLIVPACHAQQDASPQPNVAAAPVIRTRTRLVVVDVSVKDSHNRPVHDIPRSAFHLTEDRTAQNIRNFEPHTSADQPRQGPPAPVLPPGSFTNYAPVPEDGTLNVLLIDALNTPSTDQVYLRDQLRRFTEHAPKGKSIAVFGLGSRLTLLQGFTQDSSQLKDAIAKRSPRFGSGLLQDANGSKTETTRASDAFADLGMGTDDAVAALQQFESDTRAVQQQLRAQTTLDALNALGEYLSGFSGRKNLIWFSGAFPLNILADPSVANGFQGMQSNAEQARRTTELLAQARVTVYPVDARGLQTPPMYDAASSGRRYVGAPQRATADMAQFNAQIAAEQTAMQQIAADTGGRAFLNTNGLAGAVDQALEDGSDYYTLAYSPTNSADDSAFRHLHVELGPEYANRGLQLSYRPGYYALPPQAPVQRAEDAQPKGTAAAFDRGSSPGNVSPYARMALGFGAPPPQDILFQARIEVDDPALQQKQTSAVPASDQGAATATQASSDERRNGRQTYTVHFGALPNGFTFGTRSGRRVAQIAFQTLAYSPQGELEGRTGKQLSLNLSPAEYQEIQNAGIGLSLSLAAKPGSFLRLVIQDVSSGHYGALQVNTVQAIPSRSN